MFIFSAMHLQSYLYKFYFLSAMCAFLFIINLNLYFIPLSNVDMYFILCMHCDINLLFYICLSK